MSLTLWRVLRSHVANDVLTQLGKLPKHLVAVAEFKILKFKPRCDCRTHQRPSATSLQLRRLPYPFWRDDLRRLVVQNVRTKYEPRQRPEIVNLNHLHWVPGIKMINLITLDPMKGRKAVRCF